MDVLLPPVLGLRRVPARVLPQVPSTRFLRLVQLLPGGGSGGSSVQGFGLFLVFGCFAVGRHGTFEGAGVADFVAFAGAVEGTGWGVVFWSHVVGQVSVDFCF